MNMIQDRSSPTRCGKNSALLHLHRHYYFFRKENAREIYHKTGKRNATCVLTPREQVLKLNIDDLLTLPNL